jgi:hypothetical protein
MARGHVRAAEQPDVDEAVDFSAVPDAGDGAVLDPHWLQLRAGAVLPAVYLPPAMAGPTRRPIWLRAVALGLVFLFTAATAAGVCLVYGPPHLWP